MEKVYSSGDIVGGRGLRGKRYFDIFVECCRARIILLYTVIYCKLGTYIYIYSVGSKIQKMEAEEAEKHETLEKTRNLEKKRKNTKP
jgi:hydrogenase maturation factor